mmetsp:Transcript_8621/g.22435  ORF Transcript_8621/g.22435 Transcript_8621/m.22435 type:complete len:300 (-) Transcript_8621:429-1328(-)
MMPLGLSPSGPFRKRRRERVQFSSKSPPPGSGRDMSLTPDPSSSGVEKAKWTLLSCFSGTSGLAPATGDDAQRTAYPAGDDTLRTAHPPGPASGGACSTAPPPMLPLLPLGGSAPSSPPGRGLTRTPTSEGLRPAFPPWLGRRPGSFAPTPSGSMPAASSMDDDADDDGDDDPSSHNLWTFLPRAARAPSPMPLPPFPLMGVDAALSTPGEAGEEAAEWVREEACLAAPLSPSRERKEGAADWVLETCDAALRVGVAGRRGDPSGSRSMPWMYVLRMSGSAFLLKISRYSFICSSKGGL